jgi:hypothetical protein
VVRASAAGSGDFTFDCAKDEVADEVPLKYREDEEDWNGDDDARRRELKPGRIRRVLPLHAA